MHSALIGAIVQLGQLGTSQQSTRQHQLLIRAIILWKSGCYWALLLLIIGSCLCRAWMPVGAKLSLLSMRDFPGRGIVHRAASAMRCRWRQTFDHLHKILTTWMRMMLDTSWPWRLHFSSSWPGLPPLNSLFMIVFLFDQAHNSLCINTCSWSALPSCPMSDSAKATSWY